LQFSFSRSQAQKAAEEALILLKNDNFLPLDRKSLKRIAIIGPNADNEDALLGGWSGGAGAHPRSHFITLVDGLHEAFQGEVIYEKGCGIVDGETGNLTAAIEAVNSADAAFVVIGDRTAFAGETHSTATLGLYGGQMDLLDAVIATKKKFTLVVLSTKPLVLPKSVRDAASAIIWQFSPGMLGGLAFANVLAGVVNPSGKLPLSIPYHIGQLPVYYNQIKGQHGPHYVDLPHTPRWAFGYGRSYTKFMYLGACLDRDIYGKEDVITVTISLKSEGPYNGPEIVQLYVADLVTSVTWANQELKAFQRVQVNVDDVVTVVLRMNDSECSIVNVDAIRVVEPGDFEIRIGRASNKIMFTLPFTIA
jgi:beta-glucosidase